MQKSNDQVTEIEHLGRLARYPYFAMMVEGERRMRAAGLDELNPSYSIVFQFIGNGSRITDMALNANTTKQNMKYLVDVLEEKGYVKRALDATDGRAWIYQLTKKGEHYRKKGLAIIQQIEKELEAEIGVQNFDTLKKLLLELSIIIKGKYHFSLNSVGK